MQTQDDQLWSQQVTDLHADGEPGQRFLDFFLLWFECAEKLIAEGLDTQICNGLPGNPIAPADAARRALEIAEKELGFLDANVIGQMLVVATMHWAHGHEMAEQLTFIEHRVMEQALAAKIADLQGQAAQ